MLFRSERDEAHVAHDELRRRLQMGGLEFARIQSFPKGNARIAGENWRELAMADIDRDHMARTSFQQHFAEPAGRGSDIKAIEAVVPLTAIDHRTKQYCADGHISKDMNLKTGGAIPFRKQSAP